MIQWIVFPWENPSEGVRVSSGHLREAEAPTEAVAENAVDKLRFKLYPHLVSAFVLMPDGTYFLPNRK